MNVFCYVESPIGRLLLTSDGTALTGLYMEPSRKAGNPPTAGARMPTVAPARRGAAAAERIFRRHAARVRSAAAHAGHGVSAARVAGADGNSLRRDLELRRAGQAHRQSQRLARRGAREWPQSDLHHRAVPPGHRRRWFLDRLRRRPRAQALAARARGRCTGGWQSWVSWLCLDQRQRDGEDGTAAVRSVGGDGRAAVKFGDQPHDVQALSRSAACRRGPGAARTATRTGGPCSACGNRRPVVAALAAR